MTMHDGQLEVIEATVRRLIADQFAEWNPLHVRAVASQGTVNAIFRIGERLSARFRLESEDPARVRAMLRSEAHVMRELAGRTRFAVPDFVALGEAGNGYPMPWAVHTWVDGQDATVEDPGESPAFAEDLGELIAAIRSIQVGDRVFSGSDRGGDLRTHDAWVETCLAKSAGLLDVERLRALWSRMRDLPRTDHPDVMTHGDLMPGNVLVHGGRLSGVIDVAGLGPADPALDLVAAWHLLEKKPRERLRSVLGCGDIEWARGQAWAFQQAMGLVWYYETSNPVMSRIGRRTLERILDDRAVPC